MKVAEAMTRDVHIIQADATLKEAASIMAKEDVGMLPVHENDKLVGMITDRDIALRCVAQGQKADSRVRDAMTKDVKYCYEDDDLEDAMQNMSDIQVRRLPVMDREKKLTGIVALADAARQLAKAASTGETLSGIVRPGGQHAGDAARL
jgi:CBS domain-containing protein